MAFLRARQPIHLGVAARLAIRCDLLRRLRPPQHKDIFDRRDLWILPSQSGNLRRGSSWRSYHYTRVCGWILAIAQVRSNANNLHVIAL